MSSSPLNVLLIEDNPEHFSYIRQLTATSRALVHSELEGAETLQTGLERLRRGGIHLVLLDLTLPDSDGLETFVRTVEAAPEVPIIVFSGVEEIGLALETVQLGAQDYLVKGHVDGYLLARAMQYALERKRIEIQLQRAYEEMEMRVRERTASLQQANTRLQGEIAERKRAEQATLESNRQLAEALGQLRATQQQVITRERMHALGRMANGIAHDFNNTLAPILGFTELLLKKTETAPDLDQCRSYLEVIHTAARESARVVSRLQEFYQQREQTEAFAPVKMNELVEQVVSFTQPRWKDQALASGVNITIRTELGTVPTVWGNEVELREALANLVFNAIDAIHQRGTITLRTELQERWIVTTVADDGVGMTPEIKARCVEPFFSTKGELGTGLGLGSVYGTVRRHEGEIAIQSEPQGGTSVSISLPIKRPLAPPAAPGVPVYAGPPLRILVVEDDSLVREVISIFLSEDGHELTMAADGRDGLEKFQNGVFDLVMTDRAMPALSGDELARAIKRLKPGQPVILLTGFGGLMNGAGERPEGVDLIVGKPFTLSILRGAIEQTVHRERELDPVR
ncbi:MAG: response regulator [Verrucomicrobiota bacterium]|nr:response regulator [Verrucomicrobiota bacterium]